MDDRERGLYNKYRVERIDGKDKGPYFVLAYENDPLAMIALRAYAEAAEQAGYVALALDLLAITESRGDPMLDPVYVAPEAQP